jgi:hypothetical protein
LTVTCSNSGFAPNWMATFEVASIFTNHLTMAANPAACALESKDFMNVAVAWA